MDYTATMPASTTKALLLSALVIPGAGQLYLRRFKTGLVLLAMTLGGVLVMVTSILSTARAALAQLQAEGGIVDMSRISSIATEATANADQGGVSLALTLIILCWLYALIDILLARKNVRRQAPPR